MMKHLLYLFATIAGSVLLFASCNSNGFLSASSATNEVLVVMDENAWENGEAGRAIFDLLNSPVEGLPQREPNFRILQVAPENFTATFKMARNILLPDISNLYSKPSISSELDKYAVGQVIMTIKAPDTATFVDYVNRNTKSIVDYILKKEMERTAKWLIEDSGTPQTHLRQKFGINISYPKGLANITEHENFYWATNNSGEGRKDIVIYQFPYTSEKVFEKDSLIAIRDRVLGKYITGSFNSHMATSTAFDPVYKKMEVDGMFRTELRGLWEMTNDMMGGPFVSQAFVNPDTRNVIVVDVFIYAPEANKRNLLRNMEASFYTIRIAGEDTQEGEQKP